MKFLFNFKKGFTLLDVIFAIGLIVVCLVSFLGLINFTIKAGRFSQDRFVAANLAQEGYEITRWIRDENWSNSRTWNTGLETVGDFQVQWDSTALSPYANTPLNLAGFRYTYLSGTPTKFYRKIIITPISADVLDIVSQVTWQTTGKDYSEAVEGRLYNWK
jgi:Tfp pilus assembly protein PilV